MSKRRQEALYLIEHPPLEAIYAQHLARATDDDITDPYGKYKLQPTDESPLDDPSIGPYRTERIAPVDLMDAQYIGAVVFEGITDNERKAFVFVNPLNTPAEFVGHVILI